MHFGGTRYTGTAPWLDVAWSGPDSSGVASFADSRPAQAVQTYDRLFRDNLRVMDMEAISMCKKARLPILVFNFKKEGNIERAIAGEQIGTMVTDEAGSAPAGLAEAVYKTTPKGLEP